MSVVMDGGSARNGGQDNEYLQSQLHVLLQLNRQTSHAQRAADQPTAGPEML